MRILMIPLVLILSACAASLPPNADPDALLTARDTARTINKMPVTAQADLPRGTATYRGGMYAVTTNGLVGQLVGDMDMDVNFATGGVSGRITDLNLTDRDGVPTQLLGGRLGITGDMSAATINATATGDLRAANADNTRGTATFDLTLLGQIRSGKSDGSAMHGAVTGDVTGILDFDLVDGVFYGARP